MVATPSPFLKLENLECMLREMSVLEGTRPFGRASDTDALPTGTTNRKGGGWMS